MADWNKEEVEAIVQDYLSMLAAELSGAAYNKAAHRRELLKKLPSRSNPSIEFKHANISAALVDAGFPYISGYKPRSNYQSLLADVIAEQLARRGTLLDIAASDADRPMIAPEVDDILSVLIGKPPSKPTSPIGSAEPPPPPRIRLTTNYLEREARNRSLGAAGEAFILNFERARLIYLGKEQLAAKIEHTSCVRGDSEGYDILSFEASGQERLIEVKTTKYGSCTPFYVSRNELAVSKREPAKYHLYRLYDFRLKPFLFMLQGDIEASCVLSSITYAALLR